MPGEEGEGGVVTGEVYVPRECCSFLCQPFCSFLLHSFVTSVSILSAHQKSQSGELTKIWG